MVSRTGKTLFRIYRKRPNNPQRMMDFIFEKKECGPMVLDGLIYTPLDQIYTKSLKETKRRNYKWKPANKNSIDFFKMITHAQFP